MKNLIIISAAMLFFATSQMCGCGCKARAQCCVMPKAMTQNQQSKQQQIQTETKTVTLKVTGMTCAGCSNHIGSALSKTQGVISQEVKFPGDMAIVKYNPDKITEKKIIATIEKAGYKAEVKKDEE